METQNAIIDATMEFLDEHGQLFFTVTAVYTLFWKLTVRQPPTEKQRRSAAPPQDTPAAPDPNSTQLRGKLRKELEVLQFENNELESLVQQLRSEIDSNGYRDAVRLPTTSSPPRMFRGNAEILGFSWALLVFGTCLVTTRRQRRKHKRLTRPIQRSIKTFRDQSSATKEYAREVALPIASRNMSIAVGFVRKHATSEETVIGRTIAGALESLEDYWRNEILPVTLPLLQQIAQQLQIWLAAVLDQEIPVPEKATVTPYPIDTSSAAVEELQETVQKLEKSLENEKSANDSLQSKFQQLEGALRGKEDLLYEERMKTRTSRLEFAKFRLEWEESRRREARQLQTDAMSAVHDEYKRVLAGFLNEHLRNRPHHKQRVQQLLEVRFNPHQTNFGLPLPILNGISAAIYKSSLESARVEEGHREDSLPQHEQEQRDEGEEQYCLVSRFEEQVCNGGDSSKLSSNRPSLWNNKNYYFHQRLVSPFLATTNAAKKSKELTETTRQEPSPWMDTNSNSVACDVREE